MSAKEDVERIKSLLGYLATEGAKTLGAEAIRGAFYALIINEVYPLVKTKLVGTKKVDDQAAIEAIREVINKKIQGTTETELLRQILQKVLTEHPEILGAKPATVRELEPEVKAEQDALLDKINRLYRTQNDLAEKYYKGDLKEEDYNKKKAEIEKEIENTRQRLSTIKSTFR